jgi:hypothetical protein
VKVTSQGSLDRLVAGDRLPIGAAFCSFTFDPAFFEEHVLRAVLRIGSDPVEHPPRFQEEARRALQEVPVACIVDAGARSPGQRLPYDLLQVHSRVHHPKLTLLLYEDGARVGIGSGNLTRGGFGENSEVLFVYELAYNEPTDAEVLRSIDAFLLRDVELAPTRGTQLDLVLRALRRKIEATPRADACPLLFVDSFQTPILDTMLALLPDDARVVRAGILAPFLEQDDADAHDVNEMRSVLARLATLRKAKDFVLDLGVLWDQNGLERPSDAPAAIEDALGRLWVQRIDTDDGVEIAYQTVRSTTAKTVELIDAKGATRRRPREELDAALRDGRFWPLGPIGIYGPAKILAVVREAVDMSVWLHPAWRIEGGKPLHRALHAKLVTLTTVRRGKPTTFVYVGSANASRKALLHSVAQGGNVECGVLFRVEEAIGIADLAPDLVCVDPELIECKERTFPGLKFDTVVRIESAVHDAATRTLVVKFAKDCGPLDHWELEYDGQVIAKGDGAPTGPVIIEDFTLLAHCCELTLVTGEARFAIPITVADLAALPPYAALADLTLRELLALLGARVGRERLATIRAERGHGLSGPLKLAHKHG